MKSNKLRSNLGKVLLRPILPLRNLLELKLWSFKVFFLIFALPYKESGQKSQRDQNEGHCIVDDGSRQLETYVEHSFFLGLIARCRVQLHLEIC